MCIATTVFSWVLAVAPSTTTTVDSTGVSDVEVVAVEESESRPLSRMDLTTTYGSSILIAYDSDDNVAAEIAISADGLQASFDGLFIDASLAADGTSIAVECGGEPCSDIDARNAGACTIGGFGGGLGCLIGYYLAACECMGTVMVKGKDICDEIL